MTDREDKVNILIVDDRPEKVLALEAVLDDLKQNIVRAYSGREALRYLLQDDFAVILLDVNMPGMDGFETAELIRQRKSSDHIPIIFITALGDELHVARGYSLGAVDYITAPVIPEVLRTKVSVFVDLHRKTEQVRRQAKWQHSRAHQLQKLAAASLAINSAPSIDKMLQIVTDTARDLIGTHQAITMRVMEGDGVRHGPATSSYTSFTDKYAQWRNAKLDLDLIATTVVARSHAATRMTEAELQEHPDWVIVKRSAIPPVVGGMLAAPLMGRNSANYGVIYLSDRVEGKFTADDEAVLTQLAQMASTAIENVIYSNEREANRLKDEFLATLSHELRTPLNAIVGWTQLLRMEKNPEDMDHGLEVIERNVKAQTKLIEDLLDVSRIATGKLRLAARPMAVAPIIEAAIDAVKLAANSKNIEVDYVVKSNECFVSGDPDRLQQVIWNLLSNAVKFTPARGRVTVELSRENSIVQIRVSDTGKGIDPSFLPYVFDRFRQADNSSTRQHGGLGIGLTIVRHIVELHGGSVAAESGGENLGSTFTVQLPIGALRTEADVAKPQLSIPAIRAAEEESRVSLAGIHVLLVDDESDTREVIARVLEHAGAKVSCAGCADEAINLLVERKPDVLLSDIAMPDRDGYDLIRSVVHMQQNWSTKTPAIALTAYAREEDRARAISAGFKVHVSKPVVPNDLLQAIASVVPCGEAEEKPALRFG